MRFLAPIALSIAAVPTLAIAGALEPVRDAIEIDVRDLTTIEWEPGDQLPEDITRYDGRRVIIRGYMHQSIDSVVERFPMVADSCQCADTLQPHHYIDVELTRGDTDMIPGEFEVIGKLTIAEEEDEDGFVVRLYSLKGTIF